MSATAQHLLGQLADGRFALRKLLGVSPNSAVFLTSVESTRPGDSASDAAANVREIRRERPGQPERGPIHPAIPNTELRVHPVRPHAQGDAQIKSLIQEPVPLAARSGHDSRFCELRAGVLFRGRLPRPEPSPEAQAGERHRAAIAAE